MSDADVFNKLSRILETDSGTGKEDNVMDDLVNAFGDGGDSKSLNSKKKGVAVKLPDRPTPYEVWQAKQVKKDFGQKKEKPNAKLTPAQLSKMVTKMHVSSKVKQSETFKAQNEGLRSELSGYEFKPRINAVSRGLASTMKPIAERIPEMVAEKERNLARKREDREKEEMLSCAFQPTRVGAKTSDKYLKKMGRTQKSKPEDFFAFQSEKVRKNEQRKAIIESIEDREMLFSPQLPESSRKLHESMISNPSNKTIYDPVTRTTSVIRSPRKVTKRNTDGQLMDSATGTLDMNMGIYEKSWRGDPAIDDDLVEGPPLLLESDHPYRHNLNEYTSVSVPGAISYTITFDSNTATEPVADFIRFLKFDDQTVVIGSAKYSGGIPDPKKAHLNLHGEQKYLARTPSNWPGVGDRPSLVIHAPKFVVHFKTNGAVNDWGFKMDIVPTISARLAMNPPPDTQGDSFKPQISSKGHSYASASKSQSQIEASTVPIHERLYQEAVIKKTAEHNKFVQTLSHNVNIELKPWEEERKGIPGKGNDWVEKTRTHVGKSMLGPALNDLLLFDGEQRTVAVAPVGLSADGDDIWRVIRNQNALADIRGASELAHRTSPNNEQEEQYQDYNPTGADSPSQWNHGKMKMSDF